MKRAIENILWVLLASLFILPASYLLLLSFSASWQFPMLFPDVLTAKWWVWSFGSRFAVVGGMGLSLGIAAGVSLISTLAAFLSSRWMALSRHRNGLLLLAYFPFVLSPVVLAASIYIFFVRLGWNGSVAGVLFAHFLIAYPYAVILFSGYWNERLLTMDALAATLGAGSFQRYRRVLFPLSRGVLALALFQTFLISWFEYGLSSYIGMGRVPVLTVQVYRYISEANPHMAAVASLLLVFPPLLMLWVNKRFLIRLI